MTGLWLKHKQGFGGVPALQGRGALSRPVGHGRLPFRQPLAPVLGRHPRAHSSCDSEGKHPSGSDSSCPSSSRAVLCPQVL